MVLANLYLVESVVNLLKLGFHFEPKIVDKTFGPVKDCPDNLVQVLHRHWLVGIPFSLCHSSDILAIREGQFLGAIE